jgi:hypothetical protein
LPLARQIAAPSLVTVCCPFERVLIYTTLRIFPGRLSKTRFPKALLFTSAQAAENAGSFCHAGKMPLNQSHPSSVDMSDPGLCSGKVGVSVRALE